MSAGSQELPAPSIIPWVIIADIYRSVGAPWRAHRADAVWRTGPALCISFFRIRKSAPAARGLGKSGAKSTTALSPPLLFQVARLALAFALFIFLPRGLGYLWRIEK